jgi:hypothetical protein
MLAVRKAVGFLRWRLVPIYHLRRMRNFGAARLPEQPRLERGESRLLEETGFTPWHSLDATELQSIRDIYMPRAAATPPPTSGHVFENLFTADDFDPDNPVFRLAFRPELLDIASDYFGGRFRFDSIQVLHSFPRGSDLAESQKWHKDYGDNRSLHWIIYVNDVKEAADGPFVFVDRADTRRIPSSIVTRRMDDAEFTDTLGHDNFHAFYGDGGESILVDPAVCYHYGSRCERPRTAIFITFNSDRPFMAPLPYMTAAPERLFEAARQVRPDMDPTFLRRILGQ